MLMPALPARVSALLQNLAAHLPVILGKNLVGVYLYGSVTQRTFNPKRSDIDGIVVTQRDLSEAQFRRLNAWLAGAAKSNPWVARLQMSFLVRNEVLNMTSRACLFQFGVLKRSGSDGNPIIWMDFLRSGIVLFGRRPGSFLPRITPEILFQALERELSYLREEISTKPKSEWRNVPSYRVYAVLTVCRILYSFRKGAIVSKQRAARWAMKYLPREWGALILQALETYDAKAGPAISISHIEQFIDFADTALHSPHSDPLGRSL